MNRLFSGLTHPVGVRICRIAIGLILLVAGLAKVGDLHAFAEQIHNFRLVPLAAENLIAFSLPWIEVVAGLALLVNVRARSGALVGAALMAAFTLFVLIALFRGLDVECGCFGTSDASRVGLKKILENLMMLAIALVASARAR